MSRSLSILLLAGFALFLSACTESTLDRAFSGDSQEASITRGEDVETSPDIARVGKPRWKMVSEFSGSQNAKTSAFEINANEWKIEWDVEPSENTNSEFIVIMYNKNDKEDSEIIATQVGPGRDYADFEGGKGEYYLDVTTNQPYTIQISEFR